MDRTNRPTADTGLVIISEEICKGCGLCAVACPVNVLELAKGLNSHGYHPAYYTGRGCTACGICFYVCPEPGAVTVYKTKKKAQPDREEAQII